MNGLDYLYLIIGIIVGLIVISTVIACVCCQRKKSHRGLIVDPSGGSINQGTTVFTTFQPPIPQTVPNSPMTQGQPHFAQPADPSQFQPQFSHPSSSTNLASQQSNAPVQIEAPPPYTPTPQTQHENLSENNVSGNDFYTPLDPALLGRRPPQSTGSHDRIDNTEAYTTGQRHNEPPAGHVLDGRYLTPMQDGLRRSGNRNRHGANAPRTGSYITPTAPSLHGEDGYLSLDGYLRPTRGSYERPDDMDTVYDYIRD